MSKKPHGEQGQVGKLASESVVVGVERQVVQVEEPERAKAGDAKNYTDEVVVFISTNIFSRNLKIR